MNRVMNRILLLLAAPLALAACEPVAQGDAPPWTRAPAIEAQGRAYVEMAPNRARFSVVYERRANTSGAASEAAVKLANDATDAMRLAVGEDALRITSDLHLRPYYQQITRRRGEHQEDLIENVHPDALLGYVARVTVQVVVLQPEHAARARGAALAAGPADAGGLSFYLEPDAEDQRQVFAAAVRDAAERARLIASEGGASLGGLLLLREGGQPCLGQPSTPPGVMHLERSMAAAPVPQMLGDASPAQQYAKAADDYALAADMSPQRVEARVCAIYAIR